MMVVAGDATDRIGHVDREGEEVGDIGDMWIWSSGPGEPGEMFASIHDEKLAGRDLRTPEAVVDAIISDEIKLVANDRQFLGATGMQVVGRARYLSQLAVVLQFVERVGVVAEGRARHVDSAIEDGEL